MSFLLNFSSERFPWVRTGLLVSGISSLSAIAWYIHKLKSRIQLLEKYSNLEPKTGMIDLIGKTPIIELKTLSEFTGCRIYVNFI